MSFEQIHTRCVEGQVTDEEAFLETSGPGAGKYRRVKLGIAGSVLLLGAASIAGYGRQTWRAATDLTVEADSSDKLPQIYVSYHWDSQEDVKKVVEGLKADGLEVSDLDLGLKGVDTSGIIVSFMTEKYQDSKNARRELSYANSKGKVILPVIAEEGFEPSSWLGVIISSAPLQLRYPTEGSFLNDFLKSLRASAALSSDQGSYYFRNLASSQYLAASGGVTFHPWSGGKDPASLRDTGAKECAWTARRSEPARVVNLKNVLSNGFLGHDPEGNSVYLGAQHRGAEQWKLSPCTQTRNDGTLCVLLFNMYTKRFLAVDNGKLTGVQGEEESAAWIIPAQDVLPDQ